jgi:hypothetical protein
MRFRLVLFLSALVAVFSTSTAAALANGDKAVDADAPKFRLNPYTLEPGCFALKHDHKDEVDGDRHIDVTQLIKEAHVSVDEDARFSIDQVLIPGKDSGYAVYNTFDTGTINNDPDIDPDQTATDLAALDGDDVDYAGKIIVCVSDHPDADQNEPYISDGLPGEVAAINRPIIQPTIAALGVSAIEPLNTFKLGFGYSVERWYDFTWADAFRNDGTFGPGMNFSDPQSFDTDGDFHADHVVIKTRPEQPGVRRYNDIDDYGEKFANPHYEKSDHGQPEVFHMNGDPEAYLHNSVTAPDGSGRGPLGLLTFSTEGDLPISWWLKASLAPESYGRMVDWTDAEMRAWNASWQAYYRGTGPKPTLPLAPGTNSPAPAAGHIVNPPLHQTTNNTTVVQSTPSATVASRCVSGRAVRISLSKKARKGSIRYVGSKGKRTVKARRLNGRLRATADFRGVSSANGSYAVVSVREKMKNGKSRTRSLVFKLC